MRLKIIAAIAAIIASTNIATAQVSSGVNIVGNITAGHGVTIKNRSQLQDSGAAPINTGTTAGGDLSGTYPNPSVVKLQGNGVVNIAPTNGVCLVYTGTVPTGTWGPGSCAAGGAGTVTSVTLAGTAGDITISGTCTSVTIISCTFDLASIITAAGPIGDASHVAQITYDAKGRLTAVTSLAISLPFSSITGTLLSAQMPALTGDVTNSGFAMTIANLAVTNAKMAAGAAATNVGTLGGALSGTLPNPSLASGAAASNIGTLGGVLGGTLPNPSMAAGAAASNVGTLGGVLSGTLPNPLYTGFPASSISSLNLSALSTFQTCGYSACGDGGQAWYIKTGSNGSCAQTDSASNVWFPDPRFPLSVLACGAKGDGTTADQAAINSAIVAVQNFSSNPYQPRGTVYAPTGKSFKITAGIVVTGTAINVDFNSNITLFNSSANAFTWASTSPGSANMGPAKVHIQGLFQDTGSGGNSTTPTSLNTSGSSGLVVQSALLVDFDIPQIQGFSKYGAYCDGTGDVFTPQVIQKNHFEFGQVVYNGIGLFEDSLLASTSNCEANFHHFKNILNNWVNVQVDGSTHTATTSNSYYFDAMDDSGLNSNGGHGVLVYGYYNYFDFTYRGGVSSGATDNDIFLGGTADYNTFLQQNPLSTSGNINNNSATHNVCTISHVYATNAC